MCRPSDLTYIAIVFALTCQSLSAQANTVFGAMQCEVTYAHVAAKEERETKVYKGSSWGPKLGDSTYFQYGISNISGNPEYMEITLRLGWKGLSLINADRLRRYHGYRLEEWQGGQQYGKFSGVDGEVDFGPDVIRLARDDGTALYLRRHYRSEWHGMYTTIGKTSGIGTYAEIFSLECKHTDDAVDAIISHLKKYKKQRYGE